MKTSRTAIQTYQACPRKRYLQFHLNETGIEPRRQAVPLVWGQGLHVGVASLLLGNDIDEAVQESLNAYAEQCQERDFDIDDLESQSFVYAEGKALIEGFIRAWAIERLPDFMSTYEVLEVEKEGLWQDWTECVDLAYRPDALLRKRNTGGIYIFNLKSSYAWGEREQKASRYNVQGLSEMAALEARFAEWTAKYDLGVDGLPEWFVQMQKQDYGKALKVAGIQDEIFIKGSRLNRDDNTKWQMTFLVHPWLKSGITSDDDQWGWKYYFERNGKKTSLGNSYSRVSVWEHMSMKEWVEMLADRRVQDSNGLAELFATPIPHERNAAELSEWLTQARAQEQRIHADLQGLTPLRLDTKFPMYRHSCFSYQRICPYAPICHDRLSPDCGLYVPRVDHHEEITAD
jgi:hypothetical protein